MLLIVGIEQRDDRPGINDNACGHGVRQMLLHQRVVFCWSRDRASRSGQIPPAFLLNPRNLLRRGQWEP
jgi:hypothetical protein